MKETILPVALCDNKSGYVEIENADKDKTYYCPCCGGIVYPKATDSKYIIAHFCHKQKTCSGESITHFLQKWKYTKKHSIPEIGLDYDYADIEPEYKTSIGIYKPDVALHLSDGSVIFIEIKNTNGKSFDYILKWDEIGNDVIEFDIRTGEYCVLYKEHKCFCKYKNSPKEKSQIEILEYTKSNLLTKQRYQDLAMFWKKCREYVQSQSIEDIVALIHRMPQDDIVFIVKELKKYHCNENLLDRIRPTIFESIKQGYITDCKSYAVLGSIHNFIKGEHTLKIGNNWYNIFDYCDYVKAGLVVKYYLIAKKIGFVESKRLQEIETDAKTLRDWFSKPNPITNPVELINYMEAKIFDDNLFDNVFCEVTANEFGVDEARKYSAKSIYVSQNGRFFVNNAHLKTFVSSECGAKNSLGNVQGYIVYYMKYKNPSWKEKEIREIICGIKDLYKS